MALVGDDQANLASYGPGECMIGMGIVLGHDRRLQGRGKVAKAGDDAPLWCQSGYARDTVWTSRARPSLRNWGNKAALPL